MRINNFDGIENGGGCIGSFNASLFNSTPKQGITVEGGHDFSEDSCKPRGDNKSLNANKIAQNVKHQTSLL